MLSAHMDEVGFVVRKITKEGYLKLLPVGGWWGHVMPAQEMRVPNDGKARNTQGSLEVARPHGMPPEEKNKVIPANEFYLDMGVPSAEYIRQLE